jgi:hypothetical protein
LVEQHRFFTLAPTLQEPHERSPGDVEKQHCLGNWLASNPLLMSSAAYMTDFSSGFPHGVDATAGARALLGEVQDVEASGGKAWLTRLLVEGAWLDTLFQELYISGVLNLAGEKPAPSSAVLPLRVGINAERASKLLSAEEGVHVSMERRHWQINI